MGGHSRCCRGNCCVGNCSDCSNSPSQVNIPKIDERAITQYRRQAALQEFRDSARSKGDGIEKSILSESREYLDELIKDVKRYNKIIYGKKRLNINIERLLRENRETDDSIRGFIEKSVMRRISLDDKDFLQICDIDNEDEKQKKFKAFYKSVLDDAIKDLSNILRSSMENQSDKICDIIQSRIDSIYETCENKKSEFEKIQSVKESGEVCIENEQLRLSYMVALCDLGLNVLN